MWEAEIRRLQFQVSPWKKIVRPQPHGRKLNIGCTTVILSTWNQKIQKSRSRLI
jgi:hypothetical protein